MSIPAASVESAAAKANPGEGEKLPKSTLEINWGDVAGIFQRVELPRKSASGRGQSAKDSSGEASGGTGTIFAPFCQKVEAEDESEDEESDEEDLSDAAVLASHQVVLDAMKVKITAFLEARKKQQERRKNRYKK